MFKNENYFYLCFFFLTLGLMNAPQFFYVMHIFWYIHFVSINYIYFIVKDVLHIIRTSYTLNLQNFIP